MCVRFSEDAHGIINVSIVMAEGQKNNQFRGQINKKRLTFIFFPTFFYWKLHQRKKKKIIKSNSIRNIHRCTDSFSKITHTEQYVWGVTMSS